VLKSKTQRNEEIIKTLSEQIVKSPRDVETLKEEVEELKLIV
jgi:hypothetical protein